MALLGGGDGTTWPSPIDEPGLRGLLGVAFGVASGLSVDSGGGYGEMETAVTEAEWA